MTSRRWFGTARKLPSGRWQVRYQTPEGRRITAPTTFATKADAARYLSSIELDQVRGVWHDPAPAQRETLRAWSRRWLDQHSTTLTPSTAESYRGLLERCVLQRLVDGKQVGLGELSLAALTPMRVGEWLADLNRTNLSASRIRKAYRILSLAMDAAVRERLLQSNPCGKHHRLPRLPEHDPTILTAPQVELLAGHLRDGSPSRGKDRSSCQPIRPNPALALMVELMAYGGLRIGEILALRRRHVDVLGCRLIVSESLTEIRGQFTFGPTKTHQVRDVPLPRTLLADLERHLEGQVAPSTESLLFTSRTGGPVRYRSLRRTFDAACRRLGLVNVTPHSLRASCASWVAESDGVLEAARRLGHARSSVTTRHYARPMSGGDRTVADHLDIVRHSAQDTSRDPAGPPDRARSGHDNPEVTDTEPNQRQGHAV
jgi:integrase